MQCHWILGKYSTRIPLARRRFCQSFCILKKITTIPIFVHMNRSVSENLPKAQHRIRKDVDLRALKIDNPFVTNQKHKVLPWRILPTNCFQSRDLILFRHQSCRYVEHLFECEICSVNNGLTSVQVILSHEYRWFHCYSHKHFQIMECFSPSTVTFEIRICLFRTWSFTRFTNDLDSTDNSNSASSFPMTNCWGHAPPWESTSGLPSRSRGITSFTTDCAVPSWWVSSWEKPGWVSRVALQEVSSGLPDRSYISVSVFHSWEDQARLSSHFEVTCWGKSFP